MSKDTVLVILKLMYHIVPEVRFSIYITVHWVCHGVVRLVSSNGYILLPRCREVGFIQRLYIISTAVKLGLATVHYYYYYHDTFRC